MKKKQQIEIEFVFKEHYREFCLLSYSYLGCMDRAQDVVQDVFVKILTKKDAAQVLNLKAYLWRSVKNTSLKHLERYKKMEPLAQGASIPMVLQEEDSGDIQLRQKLQNAVEKLPEKCKAVFELCALEGYKYDSAADSLDISVNTVKTQMKKAYKILRYDLRNVYFILLYFTFFK